MTKAFTGNTNWGRTLDTPDEPPRVGQVWQTAHREPTYFTCIEAGLVPTWQRDDGEVVVCSAHGLRRVE